MNERVLGIDPGTAVTGYGVVERSPRAAGILIECGVIRTPARAELATRLQHLYTEVVALIAGHEPQVVSVESTFYAKNVRTTVSLSHARGVILLAAAQAGVQIAEFAPAAVKKTVVGRGQADKDQIGYMVMQLLRLREQPSPHDAADGIALALTYILTSARP